MAAADTSDPGKTREADEMALGDETGNVHAPPATLDFLIHTLFTQALMALGRIPNPITQQKMHNLPTAKHFIDTLAMLEQKTAGNRTADESRMLEEIQHQLRLMFMDEQAAGRVSAVPTP